MNSDDDDDDDDHHGISLRHVHKYHCAGDQMTSSIPSELFLLLLRRS